MAVAHHRSSAPAPAEVRVAVISVSDTRTRETDDGGALVEALASGAGFTVVDRALVRDEPGLIRGLVCTRIAEGSCDAVLVTGGTGVAPRDGTVDTLLPLFDRRLDGFGELFRALSFAEIGSAAMLSRAAAGIVGSTAIFLMPGSPSAVRLALSRLILPELAHLVGELRRSPTPTQPSPSSRSPSGEPQLPTGSHHGHRDHR